MNTAELKHRPDIDGLRAIAVLLVILFHLNIRQLPGGFIGVDVFFVISGYLITKIIANEIGAARFSIAGFYERRARRILPALVGVLIPTTLVCLLFLLPGELVAYAKSLLSATFSYSNIYFWSTADYFDAPAQSKPLLHTWSLAVEEQFYIFFPLLLVLLVKRWSRMRNSVVLTLTLASFLVSVYTSHSQPVSAFYLPFSRAWELLFGSILGLDGVPAFKPRWLRESAAISGLVMIGYAATRLTSNTPFPGVAALLPCVGSLLVLAAGRHGSSTAGKFLSLAPLTFIGLMSYSVYLWHWPLIVFSKMGFLPILPQRFLAPAILALSLLCGALSWQFIEKPFRVGTFRSLSRPRLFSIAGGALTVCASIALLLIGMHGWQSRFPPAAVAIATLMDTPQRTQVGTCFITTKYRFEDYRRGSCLRLDPDKKNYLLLGDSHSAALWYGLSTQLTASRILQADVSGCQPEIDTSGSRDCRRMMAYIFGDFLPSHAVDALLLTARWWEENEFKRLQKTVAWCAQRKLNVVILGPVMEYDAPLPKLIAYSMILHDPGLVQRHARQAMFAMDKALRRRANNDWHVQYISLMDTQCPAGKCLSFADSAQQIALMADDNHLSNAGSVLMVRKLLASGQLPQQRKTLTDAALQAPAKGAGEARYLRRANKRL